MKYLTVIFIFLFFANIALAGDVSQFVFTTGPQTIKPNEISGTLSIQAQDSGGNSVKIPQTGCIRLETTSLAGQFSSNGENWNPVNVLTMNKNTANRNFYYKDSSTGNYKMTVNIALRPTEETRTCASWPIEEWGTKWTLAQNISVLEIVSSPEPVPTPVPTLEPKIEIQPQATTIIDSQPEPEAKQEQLTIAVSKNSDLVVQEQPQMQVKLPNEPSPSTTVVEAGSEEQNSEDKELTQQIQAAQVADVINIGKDKYPWSIKEWLMIIGGIIVISVAGLFFVRRQSPV